MIGRSLAVLMFRTASGGEPVAALQQAEEERS
jgi:hypothetical protein